LHYVIDVLRGSKEQRILTNEHDKLSVYKIGESYSKAQWLTIADKLLELDAIGIGEYRVYHLKERGIGILKGQEKISIREERLVIRKVQSKKKVTYFEDYEVEIFDKLRELRKAIATENKVPPYVIFSDKTLKEMSNSMPTNKIEMLNVHGVGEVKFKRYGQAFLKLIKEINNG